MESHTSGGKKPKPSPNPKRLPKPIESSMPAFWS